MAFSNTIRLYVHNMEKPYFLDYMSLWKNIPEMVASIVKGVAEGCKMAGCALVGGETAEMPGLYAENEYEYDLAGFSVGIVDKEKMINSKKHRNRRHSNRISIKWSTLKPDFHL